LKEKLDAVMTRNYS
jgi:3-polyprenyl-4-hydroxybenzoate decarboxylase